MNNEITQNEKVIYDITNAILSSDKRYKEKGVTFRVELNTIQEDPHESKITIDLLYDDEIIDFIEYFVYQKGELIKDAEGFRKWLQETFNSTYQNLTQYD